MTPAEQEAYVDAAAALLGLDVSPWRTGVLGYFALAAGMYEVVEACDLGVHDESGEVFVPVVPEPRP